MIYTCVSPASKSCHPSLDSTLLWCIVCVCVVYAHTRIRVNACTMLCLVRCRHSGICCWEHFDEVVQNLSPGFTALTSSKHLNISHTHNLWQGDRQKTHVGYVFQTKCAIFWLLTLITVHNNINGESTGHIILHTTLQKWQNNYIKRCGVFYSFSSARFCCIFVRNHTK